MAKKEFFFPSKLYVRTVYYVTTVHYCTTSAITSSLSCQAGFYTLVKRTMDLADLSRSKGEIIT